ncbi:MAG: hypothetical protein E7254_10420 [Lachnospiraceae bacterium]|nr:hypothetical protein [Lachnospiraceae bacterium]
MNKKINISKWFSDNLIYIVSFLIPVIDMILVYRAKGVYPFGEAMYLRSDNYHQYTPYLYILQEKLQNHRSLFYTWEIGGGMNFIAIAAYYLSSPLNLFLLVWPGKIVDIVAIFIIIKMGLASFSVTYYLSKKFGKKTMVTALFGMAYALSAYFVAFNWNIMWLDCLYLFPFVVLGLEKLAYEKKGLMYGISLGLAIFSNYYIGIMICIFSVIYFFYLMFTIDIPEEYSDSRAKEKYLMPIRIQYFVYSLVGGGLAMMVILPEYFNLQTTRSAGATFPEKLEKYYSVLYMAFRSLMNIPVADLKYPHDPNIYCSVAMFLLIPLFFMCTGIKVKERVGKAILLAIMLFSFSFNIPNFIWHGFHFPNSLPCRESFIYVFLVVTMGYEAVLHIKEYTSRQIVGVFAGVVGLLLILEEMFKNAEFFGNLETEVHTDITKIIYYSLLFIVIYLVIIFMYRNAENIRGFIIYLLILASFLEMTYNMHTTGLVSMTSRKAYNESNEAFKKLNEVAKTDAKEDGEIFYRTEEENHRTRNDGALFRYNSISTFSSVSSAAIQEFYDAVGMQTSFNAYSYYGHTPVTAAMFGIKYEYTGGDVSLPKIFQSVSSENYLDGSGNNRTLTLYKNNYSLPMGFMVNSSAMSLWSQTLGNGNPFIAQNSFVKTTTGTDACVFHRLVTDGVGTISTEYALDEDDNYTPAQGQQTMDIYFFVPTSSENLTVNISTPDGNSSTKNYSSTNQNYICYVGDVAMGSTVTVTAGDGSTISGMHAYAFDMEAFEKAHAILNSQTLHIEKAKDAYLSGTVSAENDGMMFMSIPFDKGWKVYVDGKKVKVSSVALDSLMGFYMPKGEHKVELAYTPVGFWPGFVLSLLSLFVLLGFINREKLMKKYNKMVGNNNSKSKR